MATKVQNEFQFGVGSIVSDPRSGKAYFVEQLEEDHRIKYAKMGSMGAKQARMSDSELEQIYRPHPILKLLHSPVLDDNLVSRGNSPYNGADDIYHLEILNGREASQYYGWKFRGENGLVGKVVPRAFNVDVGSVCSENIL